MLNAVQLRNSLLIFFSLLWLSFAFPIHIHPYRTYYNDALVFLGLLLLLGYWSRISRLTIRVPSLVLLPAGLVLLLAIQNSLQLICEPADLIFPLIYLSFLALTFVFGATIADQKNGLHSLCLALAYCYIAAGITSVLVQHLQLFDVAWMPFVFPLDWRAPLRPFANFAQANTLALTLCFATASTWTMFLWGKVKARHALILVLIFLWGLALTQSRIGWIILPLLGLLSREEITRSKIRMVTILLCALLFVGFIWLTPIFLHGFGGLSESVQHRAGQTGIRIELWRQALAMSFDHPFFGVGWFQFGPHQVLTATRFRPSEYSEYAHNILFNFLAETGWPVTLLLCMACIFWINFSLLRYRSRVEVRYATLLLSAVAAHSLVEYPLWYGFFLFPTGLLMGALYVKELGSTVIQINGRWLACGALTGVLVLALITADYRRMAAGFVAIAKIQAGNQSYLKSIQKPDWTAFAQFYDYFHIIEIAPDRKMPADELQFLERMSKRFGFAPVLDRLAIAYANNHRSTDAVHILKVIERLEAPTYVVYYEQWRTNSKNDPATYQDVFRNLPKPEKLSGEGN